MSPEDALDRLRQALEALQEADPQGWLEPVAAEVVRLGGGDAVDLLHLALDDALDLDDPENPEAN